MGLRLCGRPGSVDEANLCPRGLARGIRAPALDLEPGIVGLRGRLLGQPHAAFGARRLNRSVELDPLHRQRGQLAPERPPAQ